MNAWVLKDEFAQAKVLWKGFYWFAVSREFPNGNLLKDLIWGNVQASIFMV
jgi:hypothetical protein